MENWIRLIREAEKEIPVVHQYLTALMEQAKKNDCGAVILESHRNWIEKSPVKSFQLSAKFLNEKV